MEADTLLTIPDVFESIDPSITNVELSKSKRMVEDLENIVLSWEKHIKKV